MSFGDAPYSSSEESELFLLGLAAVRNKYDLHATDHVSRSW